MLLSTVWTEVILEDATPSAPLPGEAELLAQAVTRDARVNWSPPAKSPLSVHGRGGSAWLERHRVVAGAIADAVE